MVGDTWCLSPLKAHVWEFCYGRMLLFFGQARQASGVEVLPRVLPDEQGGTHVHVERADDPLLGDLHTHVQQLQQVGWDALPLIAVEGGRRERQT